jgi:hypothetical protein
MGLRLLQCLLFGHSFGRQRVNKDKLFARLSAGTLGTVHPQTFAPGKGKRHGILLGRMSFSEGFSELLRESYL